MSIHISLTLEASEMFLSLHMIFILERAAAAVCGKWQVLSMQLYLVYLHVLPRW